MEDVMQLTRRDFTRASLLAAGLLGLRSTGAAADNVTAEEARAIAKEAYIYGFPAVDSYRIQYAYFVDDKNPEYKAPWNHLKNIPASTRPQIRQSRRPIPTRPIP
jgi:hypothetical protein